jgi:DNA-binding PadR family transcriptional regulator
MARQPKPEIKPTRATRRVLLVLLTGAGELSGYPISRAAMVGPGHVYVLLARLERIGWVASDWQESVPHGQPSPRRFYQLTRYGRAMALKMLGLGNDHV